MILVAVALVCLGLWNLFFPRSLMRSGAWSSAGRAAGPSDGYVVAVRAGGVVFLLLAVVVVVVSVAKDASDARERRLEAAWDVSFRASTQGGSLDDRLLVVDGLPVSGPSTSPEVVAPDATTEALRYAVVGTGEELLDPGLVSPDAADGDLVVRVAPRLCAVSRLVVAESADEVRLTVVVAPTETWHSLQRSVPQFDRDEEPRCDDGSFPTVGPSTGLTVVHVPLDRPLRHRTVVDTTTGSVVPEVGEGS